MLKSAELKVINELYYKYGIKTTTANLKWRCYNCAKTSQSREVGWRRNFNEYYCADCVRLLLTVQDYEIVPPHKKLWRWKKGEVK